MRKGSPIHAEGAGRVVTAADMLDLAPLARLYHGAEATGCEAERSFLPFRPPLLTCGQAWERSWWER